MSIHVYVFIEAINKAAHMKLMNCLYTVLQLKPSLLLCALVVATLSPQIHKPPRRRVADALRFCAEIRAVSDCQWLALYCTQLIMSAIAIHIGTYIMYIRRAMRLHLPTWLGYTFRPRSIAATKKTLHFVFATHWRDTVVQRIQTYHQLNFIGFLNTVTN